MVKFRKNQEVQKYLKDQMVHVERQREMSLIKKGQDGIDVKNATKDFIKQLQRKNMHARNQVQKA